MPVRKTTVINLCGIAQHSANFFTAYQRYGGTPTSCTFISKAFGISNVSHPYLEKFHVSKKFMVYAPSPIRLHNLGCLILEQTTGWDNQRVLGKIFQGTPGCPLAAPVPRSNHQTHLLSHPISSAHIDPRKTIHTQMNLPIYPATPSIRRPIKMIWFDKKLMVLYQKRNISSI